MSLVLEDQGKQLRDLQRGLDVGSGTHRVDLGVLSADGSRTVAEAAAEQPRRQGRDGGSRDNGSSGRTSGGARPRNRRAQRR